MMEQERKELVRLKWFCIILGLFLAIFLTTVIGVTTYSALDFMERVHAKETQEALQEGCPTESVYRPPGP